MGSIEEATLEFHDAAPAKTQTAGDVFRGDDDQ